MGLRTGSKKSMVVKPVPSFSQSRKQQQRVHLRMQIQTTANQPPALVWQGGKKVNIVERESKSMENGEIGKGEACRGQKFLLRRLTYITNCVEDLV